MRWAMSGRAISGSRATKVAAITPEAKAAAKETGLDNNQSALLQVAKLATCLTETAHGTPGVSRQVGDTRDRSGIDRFTADAAARMLMRRCTRRRRTEGTGNQVAKFAT
jgi:hypothetical protein